MRVQFFFKGLCNYEIIYSLYCTGLPLEPDSHASLAHSLQPVRIILLIRFFDHSIDPDDIS